MNTDLINDELMTELCEDEELEHIIERQAAELERLRAQVAELTQKLANAAIQLGEAQERAAGQPAVRR